MFLFLVHSEGKVHSYTVFINILALDSVGYATRCVGTFPENNSGPVRQQLHTFAYCSQWRGLIHYYERIGQC
jgi:hypothetical protein